MTRMQREHLMVVCLVAVVGLGLGFGSQFTGVLVKKDVAVRALETQGFSNIQITNKAYMFIPYRGGDSRDVARFTAEATNPAGKRVTVYVFAGWPFKGATIRTR